MKRIVVGNKDAKITIIAFESLTCSHCANFHKDVYPQLKKDYLDTGFAKIEFRHFQLDVAAFNASKISQCKNDGDSKILNSLFANQQKWVKGSSAEEANKNLEKFLKNEGFDIDFKSCRIRFDYFGNLWYRTIGYRNLGSLRCFLVRDDARIWRSDTIRKNRHA